MRYPAQTHKAQASIETLGVLSLMLMLFMIVLSIYFSNVSEASIMADKMTATSICIRISSTLGSFAALGGNSTYSLNLPPYLNSKNYSAYIAQSAGVVKINYGNAGVGCLLQTTNITNSTGGTTFQLEKNVIVKNDGGVLTVVP